jgi:hypothetical protein
MMGKLSWTVNKGGQILEDIHLTFLLYLQYVKIIRSYFNNIYMSSCIYNINPISPWNARTSDTIGVLKIFRPGSWSAPKDFVGLRQGIKTSTYIQYISKDLSLKRAILNFIKGAAKNKFENIQLDNYSLLLDFLRHFDKNIYFSKQNFSNYKRTNLGRFELYILNPKVDKFLNYLKNTYPNFKEEWLRPPVKNLQPKILASADGFAREHSDIYKNYKKNILRSPSSATKNIIITRPPALPHSRLAAPAAPIKHQKFHTTAILFKKISPNAAKKSSSTDKDSDKKRVVNRETLSLNTEKNIKMRSIKKKLAALGLFSRFKLPRKNFLEPSNKKLTFNIVIYNKNDPNNQLSLIVYTNPNLALIFYNKPPLALIIVYDQYGWYIQCFYFEASNKKLTFNLLIYNKYDYNNQLSLVKLYNKSTKKYGWNVWMSDRYNNLLTKEIMKTELALFWNQCFIRENKDSFIAIICKIKFQDNLVRSVSTTQIAKRDGFNKVLNIFYKVFYVESLVNFLSDMEKVLVQTNWPYGQVIFEYKFLKKIKSTKYEHYNVLKTDEIITQRTKNIFKSDIDDYLKLYNYKNFKLPTSMDLSLWPNILFSSDYKNAYSSINLARNEGDYKLDFLIFINDENYYVKVTNDNTLLFTFEDYMKDHQNLNYFKRVISNNEDEEYFYFEDGELKLYHKKLKTTFIETISKDRCEKNLKILTLDFETRDVEYTSKDNDKNNTFSANKVPSAISIYDGKKCYSYVFKNIDTWQHELKNFLKQNLMRRKYDYHKVYIHNSSYFDMILLLDTLTQLGEVKPLQRDDKFLKITLKYSTTPIEVKQKWNRKCTLIFYDSMLILPDSLRELAKGFNIDTKKSWFPFGFMNNPKLDFNYSGTVPKIEDFLGKISAEEYLEYCKKYPEKWVFEEELIKYCEIDTIVLYKILHTFYREISSMFKIDFTKYPTLPALSFAIYRSNYMPENTIPKILGNHHYSLKRAYYGGITEAYKPYGEGIKSYDVNSLYPSVMKNLEIPVGVPSIFSGDISFYSEEKIPYGFFKVKVKAPLDLITPALPYKIQTKNGKRTLFPVGTWESWYFSEEIRNKIQYGYKFQILEGYLFDKKNIFYSFIQKLYGLKCKYDSDNPKYIIAKMLMNSLYGRFGLNPEERESVIVSDEDYEDILFNKKQVKQIPLLSGKVLVSYEKDIDEINLNNISISVSAAISAYSRNVMTKFLMKYSQNIYSIDTDGIKIDCELDSNEVDKKELGKMKFEYELVEGVFPAPKIYGGILTKPYKKYEKEIVKVKGLKQILPYQELKQLLKKDEVVEKHQEKWVRDLSESTIHVRKEIYHLSIKESKREIVYNDLGEYVSTKPFILEDNEIVCRSDKNPKK